MRGTFWISSVAICLLAPVAAQAEYIAVRLDGSVTSVSNSNGLLPMSASVGDPMSLIYIIERTEPTDAIKTHIELDLGYRMEGTYYGIVRSMTISIDGQSFTFQSDANDPHSSQQFSSHEVYGRIHPLEWEDWMVRATAPSNGGTQYSATASAQSIAINNVPLVNGYDYQPVPVLFTEEFGRDLTTSMSFMAGATLPGGAVLDQITGEFTHVSAVPLPAAAWLLFSGLGLLGVVRRGARCRSWM